MEWGTFAADAAALVAVLTSVTALLGELRKWRRPPTRQARENKT